MSAQLKLEIDGREVEVPHGTMVMDAATKLGIYVPHFCYHKKLSIAANCRMCLVQVEKAPKPMPACATPVTDGMKVWTHSDQAKQAQNGVMELLLINHPLDCPICDQGGECQLQDLAVGYGASGSRYTEPKRVVMHKSMGPLISAEEMTRCIHCTRCVRFGQEIGGVMELGMIGRGEHSEIVSFVGKSIDSELSGNMIDVCPVGALTSKPFRYSARTWELSRKKSIAPHDSLGSNIVVQTKGASVMRVVPLENEDLNECWLSDRDRFSYEGLNSPDRLTRPMIRQGGELREVDWQTALEHAAKLLSKVRDQHGAASIGMLASGQSTLEELQLAQKLVRGLGSENVDFRLRRSDFSSDGKLSGIPWLGMKVKELSALDRVLVIGSFLRKDHPLLANRFRQAAKRMQQVNLLHVADDDLLIKLKNKVIVSPSSLPLALAGIAAALADLKQQARPADLTNVVIDDKARAVAGSLASGKAAGVFLGSVAEHHPEAAKLHALAQEIARYCSGKFGFLGTSANAVGGYLASCTPGQTVGLNARAMLEAPRKAYLLLNMEPELDTQDPACAMAAMQAAKAVISLSPYRTRATEYAQVLLPITPFTETSGSYVNIEGRLQSFNAAVKPLGESRPAWKVLRVLGNQLGISGLDFDTSEAVRDALCAHADIAARLDNGVRDIDLAVNAAANSAAKNNALERIGEVPIYFSDSIVRRAESLQMTKDARDPRALVHSATAAKLGVSAGGKVKVRQGKGEAMVSLAIDDLVPVNCVRLAAAHPLTSNLGPMFGELSVERAG
ncbi:MAG: NADH-quinone oxidoreductase subunit NuoG [Burkholderiales bacterium]